MESGCVNTTPNCDDEVVCTEDILDVALGCICQNTANDANCYNGLYCDGVETCHITDDCQPGTYPCLPLACDEDNDQCFSCLSDDDCPFCMKCDVGECINQLDVEDIKTECPDTVCQTGECDGLGACGFQTADMPCGDPTDTECDNPNTCDGLGNCKPNFEPVGTSCSDGLYCNGTDTCSAGGCNSHLGDPCSGATPYCNEGTDVCDECTAPANCIDGNICTDDVCTAGTCSNPNNVLACDDGLYCNGTDTCAGGNCTHTGNPCGGGTPI